MAITKSEIEICKNCKGEGVKYREELINYHKREYDYIPYECNVCKGSGRVRVTTSVVIEPFPKPVIPKSEDYNEGI